jgi:hypothetical protein
MGQRFPDLLQGNPGFSTDAMPASRPADVQNPLHLLQGNHGVRSQRDGPARYSRASAGDNAGPSFSEEIPEGAGDFVHRLREIDRLYGIGPEAGFIGQHAGIPPFDLFRVMGRGAGRRRNRDGSYVIHDAIYFA